MIIEPTEPVEEVKINTKIIKFQKFWFISLIIILNVVLCITSIMYKSNIWIVIILLPRVKDIILIILNMCYSLTVYSLILGFLLIGILTVLFNINIFYFDNNNNIEIVFLICISSYLILLRIIQLYQQTKYININHPQKTIIVDIFTYCERMSFILKTIEDIHTNIQLSGDKCLIKLLIDGQVIGKHNDDTIFNSLLNNENFTNINQSYQPFNHKSWKFENTLVNIATCKYKNIPIILIEKVQNLGKKDSIYLAHIFTEILNENNSQYLTDYLRENDIQKIDYIFKTDADASFQDDCIKQLKHTLETEPETQAVCGIIRTYYKQSRRNIFQLWNIVQDYQYYFSQTVRRNAEGSWGKVVCIPGPVGLFRYNELFKKVNEDYIKLPSSTNIIQYVNRFVGTDRRFTNLFSLNNSEVIIKINLNAIAYTYTPQSLTTLISQRIRWGTNSITNNLTILTSNMFIIQTRFVALIDLYRILFIYFRIFASIFYILDLLSAKEFLLLVKFGLLYSIPIIYFLSFCIHEKKILLLFGFIINKTVYTIILVYIISKLLFKFGNISWGKTQKHKN